MNVKIYHLNVNMLKYLLHYDGTNCALSTDLSVCQTSNGYSKSGGTPESCPDYPNCVISGELCYRAATNDECELGELA